MRLRRVPIAKVDGPVAPALVALGARGRLRLPMKVVRVHGVVVVPTGESEVALLLVDRDEKEVRVPVLQIHDALAEIGGLFVAEGGERFARRIGRVQFERHVVRHRCGRAQEVDVRKKRFEKSRHSPSPPCIFEKRIVEGLRGREIAAELSNLRFDPGEGEEHPVGFLSL